LLFLFLNAIARLLPWFVWPLPTTPGFNQPMV
jgi:hypothetical protein